MAGRLPTTRLHRLGGPQGDYTIAIPEGWIVDPTNNENPIDVESQTGNFRLSIGGMLWVNEVAATPCWQNVTDAIRALECDAGYGVGQWSAANSVPMVISLARQLQPGLQYNILSAPTPTQGAATQTMVRAIQQGNESDQVWIVAMLYVLNPVYSGIAWANGSVQNYWDSFAFVGACSAPVGRVQALLPTCAAIMLTFQPRGWLVAQVLADVAFRHKQVQMILKALGNPNDIPLGNYQQQLTGDASDRSVWRNWWNALGGTVELVDAGGDYYQVEDRYRYYCLTAEGPVGYDNDRPAACTGDLSRVSPP